MLSLSGRIFLGTCDSTNVYACSDAFLKRSNFLFGSGYAGLGWGFFLAQGQNPTLPVQNRGGEGGAPSQQVRAGRMADPSSKSPAFFQGKDLRVCRDCFFPYFLFLFTNFSKA